MKTNRKRGVLLFAITAASAAAVSWFFDWNFLLVWTAFGVAAARDAWRYGVRL